MGSGSKIITKFHKDWFSHTKVDREDTQTAFLNKEIRLKTIWRKLRFSVVRVKQSTLGVLAHDGSRHHTPEHRNGLIYFHSHPSK
jgi:hypothetical protein